MRDAPIRPAGKPPHSNDETEITLGSEQELKEWMFDYMKGNYLWNDAVKQVTPDYALGYQALLERILLDVAAQDDVNHDDGYRENGTRLSFYSRIGRYKVETEDAGRQAAGESGEVFRIGNADFGRGNHDKIASALDVSLGLPRIDLLCSKATASAGELLINGLRGLDLEVRLIGVRTNGKNVGMESSSRILDGYEYDFSPITFYAENARGSSDYGEGFTPDLEAPENNFELADRGSPDDGLTALALEWIDSGQKPDVKTRAAAAPRLHALPIPGRRLQGSIVERNSGSR